MVGFVEGLVWFGVRVVFWLGVGAKHARYTRANTDQLLKEDMPRTNTKI